MRQYKVFAVSLVNSQPANDNDTVFNYRYSTFEGNNAVIEYANILKSRSIIDTGVDINYDDNLITLSLAVDDFASARLLVVAREVREDEEATVDTDGANYNEDCIFPAAYIGQKPVAVKMPQSSDLSSLITSSENTSSQTLTEN